MFRTNVRISNAEKCVFISLGSNLGDRLAYLHGARSALEQKLGHSAQLVVSEIYETDAWGDQIQESFLNQVIKITGTREDPMELLNYCLQIEDFLGRVRTKKWGPRTIDVDILFFGQQIVNEPRLTIPHPLVQDRKFILAPMSQIAPNFVHPVLNKTMVQLLEVCTDVLKVRVVPPINLT